MRSHLLILFLTIVLCGYSKQINPAGAVAADSPQEKQQLCKLEGRIVNAVTGERIRKAKLTLRVRDFSAPAAPLSAVSDNEGLFLFENVKPATYFLFGEKPGFLSQTYGSRSSRGMGGGIPLTLSLGQHLKDLEFKLLPQGVITGKVLDEEGEPVRGVDVNVSRQESFGGQSRHMGMSMEMTNDLGEFRIADLVPGNYIVCGSHNIGLFEAAAAPRKEGEREIGYRSTCYPSSTTQEGAIAVTVAPGQEVSGIQITLRKGPLYRVEGQVAGLKAGSDRDLILSLRPHLTARGLTGVVSFSAPGGMVKPDGTFELRRVEPGAYDLVAMLRSSGRPVPMGRVQVEVLTEDITGVVLQLSAGIPVDGKVRVEGQEKPDLPSIRFQLRALDGFFFPGPPVRQEPDGSFRIESVLPGKYYLTFFPSPEGMYLKSVRIGTQEVLEKGIDLTQASSAVTLEVLFSPNAATVEGVVREGDQLAPGRTVTLVPDPVRSAQPSLLKTVTADQNGHFSIRGVAPGRYKLYAWTEAPPFNLAAEPELLKPFESKGVSGTVEENGRWQAELTALPPEDARQR